MLGWMDRCRNGWIDAGMDVRTSTDLGEEYNTQRFNLRHAGSQNMRMRPHFILGPNRVILYSHRSQSWKGY